jgi:hypothetical protein
MSKPLELTVYEVDPTEPSMVVVEGFWAYRPYDPAKRLTDAELAAEMHSAARDYDMDWVQTGRDESPLAAIYSTLRRFATLPHYDEDQS